MSVIDDAPAPVTAAAAGGRCSAVQTPSKGTWVPVDLLVERVWPVNAIGLVIEHVDQRARQLGLLPGIGRRR